MWLYLRGPSCHRPSMCVMGPPPLRMGSSHAVGMVAGARGGTLFSQLYDGPSDQAQAMFIADFVRASPTTSRHPPLPDAPLLTSGPYAFLKFHMLPDTFEEPRRIGFNASYTFVQAGPDLPCPHDCNGHGTCNAGRCACEMGYFGVDCQRTHCGGRLTLTEETGKIAVRWCVVVALWRAVAELRWGRVAYCCRTTSTRGWAKDQSTTSGPAPG